MGLPAAVALSIVFLGVSIGVGLYVRRFRAGMSEMTGDMVGMIMGMMTGIAVGCYIGTATDMLVANLVGVSVGLLFGAGFGRMGGLMGMLDGATMGGFMGGMMGAMLGVMVNIGPEAVWITTIFTTVVCLLGYAGLIRLVQKNAATEFARDPVCDMDVDVKRARFTSSYHGEMIYFCAAGCKRAFDRDPEHYLARALRREPTAGKAAMPPES